MKMWKTSFKMTGKSDRLVWRTIWFDQNRNYLLTQLNHIVQNTNFWFYQCNMNTLERTLLYAWLSPIRGIIHTLYHLISTVGYVILQVFMNLVYKAMILRHLKIPSQICIWNEVRIPLSCPCSRSPIRPWTELCFQLGSMWRHWLVWRYHMLYSWLDLRSSKQ